MPVPTARAMTVVLGHGSRCTRCARSARLVASQSPSSPLSTGTSIHRQGASGNRLLLAQVRPFSRASHTPTAASQRGQGSQHASRSPATPAASPETQAPLPFYELFPKTLPQGPPPHGPFHINVRTLRDEFLQLQASAHPDFHHSAREAVDDLAAAESSETETESAPAAGARHSFARARAEALSSHINEAYRTLASPLLRAQYLLQQRYGIDLAGDESTLGAGPGTAGGDSTELLMAVLEVREHIEQAMSEEDLEPIRVQNDARMRDSEAVLADAFAADDAAVTRREAVRLRYWVNIDDALRNWERGKNIVIEH